MAAGLGLGQVLMAGKQAAATASEQPATSAPADAPAGLGLEAVSLAGPMLIHVRDIPTAEISVMVGDSEVIYKDPELVARVVKAAMQSGRMGA